MVLKSGKEQTPQETAGARGYPIPTKCGLLGSSVGSCYRSLAVEELSSLLTWFSIREGKQN